MSIGKSKRVSWKDLDAYRNRVQVHWATHSSMDEISAKHHYVKMAQSLKTYGVTCFLVKEKLKLKNKMTPILFGVAKELVMRIDLKSKDVSKFIYCRLAFKPHEIVQANV